MTTYTWNVDADGNWSTKADWTPSGPPTTGADVVIDTKDFHTVTYSTGSVTIDTLTVGNDSFALSGGTLTISDSATFGVAGDSDTLSLSGGTLAFATPSVAGTISVVNSAYLQTAGTLSVASGAEVDLDGGGSSAAGGFAVASGGVLNFDGTDFTITGGTYNVAGETEIGGGTVDFSAATITSFGSLLAIGSGELELGTKNATISAFSSGDGTVDGTGTLTITGSATIENGAAQTGSGRTVVSGTTNLAAGGGLATLNLDGGRIFENAGTVTWSGGNIDMGFEPYNPSTGGGTIQNDSGATFNIQSDESIYNYAGTVTFNNAGMLEKTATNGTT
jgi:hypothetical protein